MRAIGQDETQRRDQMRGLGEQHLAFGQCLAHQAQLIVFEIAQPAMHQLAACRRRVLRQVALFAEKHGQPAASGIGGDPDAIDACANHGQVVDLGYRCEELVLHGPYPLCPIAMAGQRGADAGSTRLGPTPKVAAFDLMDHYRT